ncbi:TetR/AcrR family transcriptional regulator [Geodermatophilus sabuli]|uniref:Transcriptional regulator, TetR family n=1 Tax=Geodermatophilus sabuli TaxID=1564158 RepID=A0A285EG07_9ACTN|nr:TetR/AcrR family transcriptional regulator [Geodermatophilus sabuli]MBB3086439.1 AcrR family transcriptional regulator [Geodermatophilus sabuli]SNX97907.1 transcriptional regulator, TetR family [Geodermatophilus sabuli]
MRTEAGGGAEALTAVGPLGPDVVPLPGWAPHAPVHARGAHTRGGNAMNRTRAGLLDGAARAFATRGLRRCTMQSIATAAGVAKATLYNHFRTKDEVARALLAAELERLSGLVAVLPPVAALAALADQVAGHPVLRRLAEDEPDVLVGLLTAAPDRWTELVTRLAGALRAELDAAELVARWLVGVALQPGEPATRRAGAGRLAAVVVQD